VLSHHNADLCYLFITCRTCKQCAVHGHECSCRNSSLCCAVLCCAVLCCAVLETPCAAPPSRDEGITISAHHCQSQNCASSSDSGEGPRPGSKQGRSALALYSTPAAVASAVKRRTIPSMPRVRRGGEGRGVVRGDKREVRGVHNDASWEDRACRLALSSAFEMKFKLAWCKIVKAQRYWCAQRH
jgi:hypothetical protein